MDIVKNPVLFAVALALALTGCSKKEISPAVAAEMLRKYQEDFRLSKDEVEVLKVNELGEHAVAEVKVTLAFRYARTPSGWQLREIRTPDGQWQRLDLLQKALDQLKTAETRKDLEILSAAVERYRVDHGNVPAAADIVELNDLLVPRFLERVIRIDSWQNELAYSSARNSFHLSSAGPDRKKGTGDDIEIRGQGSGVRGQ